MTKKIEIERLTSIEKKQVTGGSVSEHIELLRTKTGIHMAHDCDPNDTDCHPDDYWDCGHNEYNDTGYSAYEDYNDRS